MFNFRGHLVCHWCYDVLWKAEVKLTIGRPVPRPQVTNTDSIDSFLNGLKRSIAVADFEWDGCVILDHNEVGVLYLHAGRRFFIPWSQITQISEP
jgi:hypothetical protein